jgi:hypothetical protein
MAPGLPTATRNAACDAIVDRFDLGSGPGVAQIRTGSKPASPNDVATGTLLATVTLQDPAFGNAGASNPGEAILNDPGQVTGVAVGTAGWFRGLDSSGNSVFDGTVSTTGGSGDLQINTTAISVGLAIDVTGGTVTMPAGG